MKITTICFLIKEGEVLLAMKKRGFGVGKWNGVGGKVIEGESIPDAAIREIQEEIGVMVAPEDLRAMGSIQFIFKDNPGWDNHMHVFCAEKWTGEPTESEEMRPQWCLKDKLPFNEMWADDPYWLPKLLAGGKVNAEFFFNKMGDEVLKYEVR